MEAFVIGNRNVVQGFQLVGIRGASVSNRNEAVEALTKAINTEGIRIILVSDDFSSEIQDEIDTVRSKISPPIITEIPIIGEGIEKHLAIQKMMERIMGIRM